jgi:cbb3-type cytochrome oxidase subunit 1
MATCYFLSVFFLLLMIAVIPFVFVVANKPPELLNDPAYKANFDSVYAGFKLDDGISKYFRAFDVMRFVFFGLVLVLMYYLPLV